MPCWAPGSPKARGHARGPLAASVSSEEEDEQGAAEEALQEEQAVALAQSLQQLEQMVVAGESLCRSVMLDRTVLQQIQVYPSCYQLQQYTNNRMQF